MFFSSKVKKIIHNKKGFTLIETMVAITVLLLAIVSPLTLTKQGVASTRYAKNQITAFFLAQDAIEFIRNVRDSNFLSGANWLSGLEDCVNSYCSVDVTTSDISSCSVDCDSMRMSTSGLYGYDSSWGLTSFKRRIRIVPRDTTNIDEVYVEVEILWDNDTRNFKVRESLFKLI